MTRRSGFLLLLVTAGWGCRAEPSADDGGIGTNSLASRIELQYLATISDSAVPGALATGAFVTRGRDGRFYVASQRAASILVFESDGRFIRTLGRRGAGPGEYRMPGMARFGPDDSIYVFDMQLRRTTVLSPQGEYVRSFPAPWFLGGKTIVLDAGTIVVAEDLRTPDRVGFPLHAMSPDGKLGLSFGADTPQYRPDLSALTRRHIAHAGRRQVWSARPTSYVLERWDPDTGARTARLERHASWFEPYLVDAGSDRGVRPQPLVSGVWEDSHERLWVLIQVADEHWQPMVHPDTAEAQATRHDPAARATPELIDQLYDWVIEVLDMETGALVAQLRLPGLVLSAGGTDGSVLATRASEDVIATRYDLWQPRLVSVPSARRIDLELLPVARRFARGKGVSLSARAVLVR